MQEWNANLPAKPHNRRQNEIRAQHSLRILLASARYTASTSWKMCNLPWNRRNDLRVLLSATDHFSLWLPRISSFAVPLGEDFWSEDLTWSAGCRRWRCGTAVTAKRGALAFRLPQLRQIFAFSFSLSRDKEVKLPCPNNFISCQEQFLFQLQWHALLILLLEVLTIWCNFHLLISAFICYRHKMKLNSHLLYKLRAVTVLMLLSGDSTLLYTNSVGWTGNC